MYFIISSQCVNKYFSKVTPSEVEITRLRKPENWKLFVYGLESNLSYSHDRLSSY